MCSKSAVGALQAMTGGGGGVMAMAAMVSAARAKAFPDKYLLLDVREAGEPTLPGAVKPECVNVPLGALLVSAYDRTLDKQPWFAPCKTLLVLCNEGMRGRVAATELSGLGYNAAFVPRGMLEWGSPAATKPDFLVTLTSKKPEQVTLAIAAAKTAQMEGQQAVIAALDDGIDVFRKAGVQGCAPTDIVTGMPPLEGFPVVTEAWDAFKANGGLALMCTSCCNNRGLAPTDMLDGAKLFGMPDLVRMTRESSGSLTFA